jgi:hypothetical protein
MEPDGEVGADLRNYEPGSGAHVHQHPHRGSDGSMGGEMHSHGHDHAHDRDADSDGGHDGNGVGMANEISAIELAYELAEAGGLDLGDLDPSPDEVAAVMDVIAELDEQGWGGIEGGGHPDLFSADDLAAAEWAGSLSGPEWDDLLAEYEADTALGRLPGNPELAGADAGNVIDLAGDMRQIDAMLSQMTDREHQRQVQDAAESGRRGSTETRLANALGRLGRGTYLYGQEPAGADLANWQGGTADDLFSTGPSLNAAEVADHMRYQLHGGARPQGRGRFTPPVRDLAARIGLR